MNQNEIISQLRALARRALQEVNAITSPDQIEAVRLRYFGRKNGELVELAKWLPELSGEARRLVGQVLNEVKSQLEIALTRAGTAEKSNTELAQTEWLDVTLPGLPVARGHEHLVTQTIQEIEDIFARIGFYRSYIPEVDWDYYAFESLNMPKNHPARDEWETFFITPEGKEHRSGRQVLTPHTSSGQVREMEKGKLPIRTIVISKCYRRQIDISHTPMFHQFEGLYIDKQVSIVQLKGVLDYFAQQFFGPTTKTRIRPFHFQFTEPSFEVDVTCALCAGGGCRYCKAGWSEIGGAGMVHPNVLRAGGVDPKQYSGFAFGWGVERVALMKPGRKIPDLRMLYQNDLRFLEQF